jgi:hypothetical protein
VHSKDKQQLDNLHGELSPTLTIKHLPVDAGGAAAAVESSGNPWARPNLGLLFSFFLLAPPTSASSSKLRRDALLCAAAGFEAGLAVTAGAGVGSGVFSSSSSWKLSLLRGRKLARFDILDQY